MEKLKQLTIKDAESISDAILKLVLQYDNYPDSMEASHATVKWNSMIPSVSIGLFPMQGAVYTKQYLSGNYEAQFPFRIQYRSSPTSNPDMLHSQSVLENLAKWLEECDAEFKDEHITLNGIDRTSVVYPYATDATGLIFACTMTAKYFYKKQEE